MEHSRRQHCRVLSLFVTAALLAALAPPAAAASFPQPGKTVRIVVPFAAGGQTDIQARTLAAAMAPDLGVPVIVENKAGGGTIIATQDVIHSAPDGHSLLYTIAVTAAQNPHLFSKLPYDPFRDLTPVMFAAKAATILSVPASSPYRSVAELVVGAKAKPGALTYGSFATGSTSHLNAAMLSDRAGIEMVHVPYKEGGPAQLALMAGEIDLLFDGPATALAAAKSGKTRMLAVADDTRYKVAPEAPTIAEAGYPDLFIPGGMQFFGPAGMPPEVVKAVNDALRRALQKPDVVKIFDDAASEIVASTAEEHARSVKEQYDKWGAGIRKLGLRLD